MVIVVDASCMWGQGVHFAVNLKLLFFFFFSFFKVYLKLMREGKDESKGRISKPSRRIPLVLKSRGESLWFKAAPMTPLLESLHFLEG